MITGIVESVLLVDDDEATNFIHSIIIDESGCVGHLHVEQSGQKALDYLRGLAGGHNQAEAMVMPQILFVDINMPRMNGWEFLEEYQELMIGRPEKAVIVLLTTSVHPDDKMKGEAIPQVAAVETKPMTAAMIRRIAETYFCGNKLYAAPALAGRHARG